VRLMLHLDHEDAHGAGPMDLSGRSRRQLLQQCLRLLQIARVKPFSEPPVNRSQQFASLLRLALRAPDTPYAGIFPNFWLSSGMGVQCSLLSQ
jgi:hypothetical protein